MDYFVIIQSYSYLYIEWYFQKTWDFFGSPNYTTRHKKEEGEEDNHSLFYTGSLKTKFQFWVFDASTNQKLKIPLVLEVIDPRFSYEYQKDDPTLGSKVVKAKT